MAQSVVWTGQVLVATGYGSGAYKGTLVGASYDPATGDWTELPPIDVGGDSLAPRLGSDDSGNVYLVLGRCGSMDDAFDVAPGDCPYELRSAFALKGDKWETLTLPPSLQNAVDQPGDSTTFLGPSGDGAYFSINHRIAKLGPDAAVDLGTPPASGISDLCASEFGLTAVRALTIDGDPVDLDVQRMDEQGSWTSIGAPKAIGSLVEEALAGGNVQIPTPACGRASQTIFMSSAKGGRVSAAMMRKPDDETDWNSCAIPDRAVSPFRAVLNDRDSSTWVAADLAAFGSSVVVQCNDGVGKIVGASATFPPLLALRAEDNTIVGVLPSVDETDLQVVAYR